MEGILVKDITKRYGDKVILNNISFHIRRGEFFGLIGPNGAGKSTLIKIMSGLVKQDQGDIRIDGMGYRDKAIAIKRKLGVVPQEIALLETVSGRDNLEYFARLYGLRGKTLKTKVKEVLELTGLTDHQKKKVKAYSGGMKRRLNLAAAIMHQPEYLILDEPTVGVDAQSRNAIFDYIKDMNEQGTTVLYTSHYMEEVEALCDNIFILDLGKEVAYGTKENLRKILGKNTTVVVETEENTQALLPVLQTLPGVESVQGKSDSLEILTRAKEFHLSQLIHTIENENQVIMNIRVQEPSLEEVFLTLTGKTLRD